MLIGRQFHTSMQERGYERLFLNVDTREGFSLLCGKVRGFLAISMSPSLTNRFLTDSKLVSTQPAVTAVPHGNWRDLRAKPILLE